MEIHKQKPVILMAVLLETAMSEMHCQCIRKKERIRRASYIYIYIYLIWRNISVLEEKNMGLVYISSLQEYIIG